MGNGPGWRLVEVEESRRIAVEDLLDLLGGQSRFVDVLERPPIGLDRQQHREVAARDDVVRAEGLAGTPECGLRTPSNGVVVEAASHHAWRTEQVWRACLAIESCQQHRDQAPQVRNYDLDIRIPSRDVSLDQMKNDSGVLHGRPGRRRKAVVIDKW